MTISVGPSSAAEATVCLFDTIHPAAEKRAEQIFGKVVRPGVDGWTVQTCLQASDGILLRAGYVRAPELAQAPRLKMISRNGSGTDMIDLAVCKERGIIVTALKGGNAPAVAELALTLMLSLTRRVKEVDSLVTSGTPVPSLDARGPGLLNKSIGLIGMGHISLELARFLQPFSPNLHVYSPSSASDRWAGLVPHERVETLDEMLQVVDVLSIHCPLTPQTKGLIGEREIGLMKPGAVLINTARGGIVDERALEKGLKEGKIGGAGLDCFEKEPAYGENLGELGKMRNVICLPHVAASTEESLARCGLKAVDNLMRFFDGEELPVRVV